MIDYHKNIVSLLSQILPTHYEMTLYAGLTTPCISYMELANIDNTVGNTKGYSDITYQIKVWDTNLSNIQKYSLEIDAALRGAGFTRIGGTELYDNNSGMIQKILTYTALAVEDY